MLQHTYLKVELLQVNSSRKLHSISRSTKLHNKNTWQSYMKKDYHVNT